MEELEVSVETKEVTALTANMFLNLYNIIENNKNYYIASRRKMEELTCVTGEHDKCDAVMVVPQFTNGDLILLKQYRKAVADYIFEFPAGLVDPGETIEETATRELKEETGLDVLAMELYMKPSYSSVGMTDECVAVYKAIVDGEISLDYKSENEDIEVVILKPYDIPKLLEEETVAMRTALILKAMVR